MAYCTATDVRIHGPQIPSALDPAAYITDAAGIIDSVLRGVFTVPLVTGGVTSTDQIIKTICAKLAAGNCLVAYYSTHTEEPNKYALSLIDWAMKKLGEIAANPKMISSDLNTTVSTEEARDGVIIGNEDDPAVFDLGNPGGWR